MTAPPLPPNGPAPAPLVLQDRAHLPHCWIAVRSDASLFPGEVHRAGIAANVRVYSMTMQQIGGINSGLVCRVLGIHEAELIAYELGLWIVAHPLLARCLRRWGFADEGRVSMVMTEHYYDRESMFRSTIAGPYEHGPRIQELLLQVRRRFPAARLVRSWTSRHDPWFRQVDLGARHVIHFHDHNRPIWLHRLYGAISDFRPRLRHFTYPGHPWLPPLRQPVPYLPAEPEED